MKKVIEARGLSKNILNQKILDNIQFDLNEGECLGIVGPKQSGKSTLLKILSCRIAFDHGDLYINDIDAKKEPSNIKKIIGVLPEEEDFDWEFSPIENLTLFASYFGLSKSLILKKSKELFQKYNLEEVENISLDALNKNQIKILQFCRALITNPEIYFIDELTMNINDKTRELFFDELMKEKKRDKSIILATEDLNEIEFLCDKVIVMASGKIIANGCPRKLVKEYVGEEIVELTIESRDLDYYMGKIQNEYEYKIFENSVRLFLKENQKPEDAIKSFASSQTLIRKATLEDLYAKFTDKNYHQVDL
ncbi:MAG: ABC transporter ATP-binding protein [Bdellovibrionales bacterium]|nr:ABC transporter ATP-binding protein [Bdellovibrionales bacterium]